jgi:hypothetical protein
MLMPPSLLLLLDATVAVTKYGAMWDNNLSLKRALEEG